VPATADADVLVPPSSDAFLESSGKRMAGSVDVEDGTDVITTEVYSIVGKAD